MNFACEAYIGNYINRFRKATGISNLSENDMHYYLSRRGVRKTIEGGYTRRELENALADKYFLERIRNEMSAPKPAALVAHKKASVSLPVHENKTREEAIEYWDSIQPNMPEADMKTVSKQLIEEDNKR